MYSQNNSLRHTNCINVSSDITLKICEICMGKCNSFHFNLQKSGQYILAEYDGLQAKNFLFNFSLLFSLVSKRDLSLDDVGGPVAKKYF